MSSNPDWLESYATDRHDWHETTSNGRLSYFRRIGVVETFFDIDGCDFEGRADLTIHLQVELKTSLAVQNVKERILLAWSILRQAHVLLSTKVLDANQVEIRDAEYAPEDRLFVFQPVSTPDEMLAEAKKHASFLEEHYDKVDADDFFVHTQNSSRCIDASIALGKLYVLPVKLDNRGLCQLDLVLIAAHEITDGLSSARWISHFVDLLNTSSQELASYANDICQNSALTRLPPAQESLYPPMQGNLARQRWSWLLSRILRHTRNPPPASFQNPLRRKATLDKAVALSPRYSKVIDYSRVPPLNSYRIRAALSPASTRRLAEICRKAKISIGSGGFALVAIVMMLFEERRNPNVPLNQRLPFVGSFPINPRPFLTGTPTTGKEDSLMLAFSDGITLPFLPSDLEFEGRLKLLGKQAARQLRQYQKRPRSLEEEVHMGSKSPTQLFPLLYLGTIERREIRSRPERKRGWDIQGAYPAKTSATLATCGVSSVGARGSILSSGKHDTSRLPPGVDVVADFRKLDTSVRARDGEFLVGVVGDQDCIRFGVSYDGCGIDPELAQEFKHVLESILESGGAPAAKL
ncbi:hypothetical protein PV11_07222 [Exophiala sideris]|uniref:Condensation domain-containing protein n=1 Tax=Exophiala sideris TaxID=1016849 RepID=A0A0D1YFL3_9EURO|nr:hypothetical protein PV11_07222 [Exophiala sideris]